ncbi:MAG: PEP-utilizing enzyme [Candidatus Bathyarchaeota archaeon]|nr:PEP-utilizing enzyme [Candidatus Bathyarchaeota archaeon]MDH5745557.1 PEP-utilizing enzyme [Candidatus Bathyarchaeota archaeon]
MANLWLLVEPVENWKAALIHKPPIWRVRDSSRLKPSVQKVSKGDFLAFYAVKPVSGIVGFGKVESERAGASFKRVNIYSNKMAKDRLPGMIKPLVWSVTAPLLLSSWRKLFVQLTGHKELNIGSMIRTFHYRAYFNLTLLGEVLQLLGMPKESIEILTGEGELKQRFTSNLGIIKSLPRVLFFALGKVSFAKKINHFLPLQNQKYRQIILTDLSKLDESTTLQSIDALYRLNEESSYFLILTQLINGFLTSVLSKFLTRYRIIGEYLNRTESKTNVAFIIDTHLSLLHEQYAKTSEELKMKLKSANVTKLSGSRDSSEFVRSFKIFIDCFGHLSDSSNDFSSPQWKENLPLLLKVIEDYSRPKSSSAIEIPHARDALFRNLLSKGVSRLLSSNSLAYQIYAVRLGFLYIYGYSLFRPFFLHLGVLYKNRGFIENVDDIFYLTYRETRKIASSNQMSSGLKAAIQKRKSEMNRSKNVELPDLIFGELPKLTMVRTQETRSLQGLAVSKGYYEGRAKVVRGLSDFSKTACGDVIVIPYSDIGWTPLFAKAKAVVSESGGMLSHCSIVAREYGIPAVVSVKNAMQIKENAIVAVDGFKGTVTIIG